MKLILAVGGTNLLGYIGLLWTLHRIDKKMTLRGVEHEMLMGDYCERRRIRIADLPTRREAR